MASATPTGSCYLSGIKANAGKARREKPITSAYRRKQEANIEIWLGYNGRSSNRDGLGGYYSGYARAKERQSHTANEIKAGEKEHEQG